MPPATSVQDVAGGISFDAAGTCTMSLAQNELTWSTVE